jgi:beta-lactamase regulating signal transducer with metallopeptidase domain
MPVLFTYLLKLSVSLAVVFIFYHLVLRKLTFYNWNRWYLLGHTLLCFFIPFINISSVLQKQSWAEKSLIRWVPAIENYAAGKTTTAIAATSANFFTAWNIITGLLIVGMVIMLLRLLIQLYSFQRMVKKAGLISGDRMRLYQVNDEIIPFSFGNAIFINRHLHTKEELDEIIRHEFVHVRQKHSADIIWGEIFCLLNWYNPLAWLLKKAIRQNLEFIADNKVLENGINKKQYQYLLLKVIGNNQFSIASPFNFSSLKKRMAMMNKMKSTKRQLLRMLFLFPATAVLLLAFRQKMNETGPSPDPDNKVSIAGRAPDASKTELKKRIGDDRLFSVDTIPEDASPNDKGYYIDLLGDIKMSKATMKGKNGKEYSGYTIDNKDECTVVVSDKNRKEVVRMSLAEWLQKEQYYKDLYGQIPEIPIPSGPPSPPVPPIPPTNLTTTVPSQPTAPTPPVKGKESNLSSVSDEFEITDKQAVLKLKNGSVEKYDLTNPEQRSAFEKKYGKIITAKTKTSVSVATVAVISKGENTVITPVTITSISPVAAISSSRTITKASTINTVVSPVALSKTIGSVAVVDDYGPTITGNEDLVITITKNTTRQELETFKKQMKEKGVELNFGDIEYNSKGILIHITGTMKAKNGDSEFSATDFYKLVLSAEDHSFKVIVKDNKNKEVI